MGYTQRMAVVLLILIAVAAFGILGFVVLGATSRKQKNAEANSESILDRTFDGRENVTVDLGLATLKYETVINGAEKRGYTLTHEASNQYGPSKLMFRKS